VERGQKNNTLSSDSSPRGGELIHFPLLGEGLRERVKNQNKNVIVIYVLQFK